jgi:predicted NACHT family NTPase
MTLAGSLDLIGVTDAIKKSFASVFGELNLASEAWFQKTRLLTVGRDNYANYMATKIGVFPLFATNRSATVDSNFVSVDISTDIERDRYRSREEIELGLERLRRGKDSDVTRRQTGISAVESITATSGGFALVGTPGSGKTTLFRSIALRSARGERIRGRKRIPIFLALRDLSIGKVGIHDAIVALFKQLEINEAERVVDELLKSGDCIVLLDGLDETSIEHQRSLIKELLEIKAKNNSCIYCVSARPSSLSIGLPDFIKWETLPLSFRERLSFIEKWFSLIDPSKGQRLIKKSRARPELLDLGSNPLMLSIVCALFNNDLDIPSEPDELYERAVHGLLGGWDAFRNIARKTILADIPVRKRIVIVSRLAAELFDSNKLVFSSSDVDEAHILRHLAEVAHIEPLDADDLLASFTTVPTFFQSRAIGH